jgi:PAS domain S-box-containing protein
LARSVGPWVFWIFLLFSVYLLVENEIIMNALNKTKEDLLIELQKLQKEYFAFKEKYEKDIGNHMGVEEKLTISETNYRRLFETAKDGIIILDAETGMITDVNPFLVELLGYRKEKFLEKAIWDIGFFKDIVANHDKFIELKQKGYVRYDDLPLESIAGRKIRVEFVSNVYPVNHHMVIQCNIRDITERKTTEEELLQEQSLMFALMDNLPDHIYFKDRESRFLRNNKAHVLSFGLTDSDQLVGKSDFDFFTKDVAQRQYNDEQEVIRTGHPINKVEFTIRKDNSVNWYYSTKMPLRDKERLLERSASPEILLTASLQSKNYL